MKSKKKRIVRYRKPININIGMIILSLVFIYLGINCIIYISRDKISIYEVTKGESEIVQGITATGIALRKETVTNAPTAGYINYYVKEGTRVSIGNTLYTIDENGAFSELLSTAAENDNTLTSSNISEIKTDISKFVMSYNPENFNDIYEFKYDLDATLLESINLNALDTINSTLQNNGGTALSINKAGMSGIVEFYTDGFESIKPEAITKASYDRDSYTKNSILSGETVEADKPIYKTIDSEDWQIVIPLTKSQCEDYKDTTVVDIYFPTDDITTVGYFNIIKNGDENYGVIGLRRYMIQFADKRFVDVQILGDVAEGLKIPKTSLVDKDFYTIPTSYLTTGGDSGSEDIGFQKEFISDGTTLVHFVPANIICKTDEVCYIDSNTDITKGDVIVKPDSNEKYSIDVKAKLSGVYNVNTGYTTFRYVDILSEKNGYYIVNSGSQYGLQVYDQIVLNSSLVKENQVIFK